MLFIHGGSFRTCSKETHQYAARALVQQGLHVYVIDYGLAPRHPYPVAHHDAFTAYRWLAEGPGRGARLATAGDSAGANMALSVAVTLADERRTERCPPLRGMPMPSAVICHSGLLRVRGSARAYRDDPLARARLTRIEQDYLGSEEDPWLAEPLAAIETTDDWVDRLPPIFIGVGDRDPIVRDSEALWGALPRAAPHRIVRYPGKGHAFMISPLSRTAAKCWSDTGDFLIAPGR